VHGYVHSSSFLKTKRAGVFKTITQVDKGTVKRTWILGTFRYNTDHVSVREYCEIGRFAGKHFPHGLLVSSCARGTVISMGRYSMGVRVGRWLNFWENGQLRSSINYKKAGVRAVEHGVSLEVDGDFENNYFLHNMVNGEPDLQVVAGPLGEIVYKHEKDTPPQAIDKKSINWIEKKPKLRKTILRMPKIHV